MAKHEVSYFDTKEAAESALELVESTIDAYIEPYEDRGVTKWALNAESHAATNITQLTAPGVSDWIATGKAALHTVAVTIAAINTNVVLRVEGSIDGTTAFNLSTINSDTTIIANGVYGFSYNGALTHIRVNFVSESGGVAATVSAKYIGV
jgi:hypothetical protein